MTVREVRTGVHAYLRERRAVVNICQDFDPAVVHSHGYRADVVDGWSLSRRGLPVVSTVHGYTGGDWKNRAYEWIQRRALRHFDAVVAVSMPLARRLMGEGIPSDRIWTIRNAWSPRADLLARKEARRVLGVHGDSFNVGWVGRLSREKGPDVMIEALGRMDDTALTLSMVGAGPMEEELRHQAEAQGVADRIRWVGELQSAAEVYSGFDAFVLSSRTEGTPMVLFEAAEAGVPVVACRVGGVPDVLTSKEAILVPREDPAAIAEALERIRRQPSRARERVRAARGRVSRQFGMEEWLRRYDEVYRSVAGVE